MKKCKKCGAVQSDDRNTCIDCGTMLGHPMTEAEEEMVEDALDDKLDNMADKTEDFYVPVRDKIMGIICIIGIIAAVVLLALSISEYNRITSDIPEGVWVQQTEGAIVTMRGDDAPDYSYPTARTRALDSVQGYAFLGILSLIAACPMLFFPRFMWFLGTLKYRVFYNWDTTPSYFALVMRKAVTYLLFGVGAGSILYAYFLYF